MDLDRRYPQDTLSFQVMRAYYMAHNDRRALIPAPMVMQRKTTSALVSSMLQHLRLPFAESHSGVTIFCYCSDTAGHEAVSRMLGQICRRLILDRRLHDEDELAGTRLVCLHVRCCIHQVQSCFRGSLEDSGFHCRELLKSAWVVCDSLRCGMARIRDVLPDYLCASVHYEDASEDRLRHLQIMFRLLDVADDLASMLLSAHCDVRGGRMCVRASLRNDGMDCIVLALSSAFSIERFDLSRWLQVGSCSRKLTVALMMGLGDVVRWSRRQPDGHGDLGGFAKLWDQHPDAHAPVATAAHLFALGAVSCKACGDVLYSMVADDRIMRDGRLQSFRSSFQDLIVERGMLHEDYYDHISQLYHFGGGANPKSACLTALHCQFGYLEANLFAQFTQLPLSLFVACETPSSAGGGSIDCNRSKAPSKSSPATKRDRGSCVN